MKCELCLVSFERKVSSKLNLSSLDSTIQIIHYHFHNICSPLLVISMLSFDELMYICYSDLVFFCATKKLFMDQYRVAGVRWEVGCIVARIFGITCCMIQSEDCNAIWRSIDWIHTNQLG